MSVDRWLVAMSAEGKRSETVRKYLTTISAFQRWLAQDYWTTTSGEPRVKVPTTLAGFSREDVELYVATRQSREGGPAKARTRKAVLTAVRSFARSQRADIVLTLSDIKIKIPRPEARPMPPRHAEAMMRYYEAGTRNHLLLLLLFETGMRVGEVVQVSTRDVCLDAYGTPARKAGRVVSVLSTLSLRDEASKTGHRSVALSPRVVSAFKKYIEGMERSRESLFSGRAGSCLSVRQAEEVFSAAAKAVGAPMSNPHSARAFFITSMVESAKRSGTPQDSVLPAICRQTGVSIGNLMHYVQPSEETIRDLMRLSFESDE